MSKDKRTYYEKLKDPRWQEMRLRVLEREKFTCQCCHSKDETLHVHHGHYKKGADPWDYDVDTLHCLCEECHEAMQERLAAVHHEIASLDDDQLCNLGLMLQDLKQHWPCRWYKGQLHKQKDGEHCSKTGLVYPDEEPGDSSEWL